MFLQPTINDMHVTYPQPISVFFGTEPNSIFLSHPVESRYILFLGFNKFFSFSVPNFVFDGLLLLTAMVRFVVRGFELKCPLNKELPVEEALFSVLKHCHLWKPTNTTQSLSKVIYNCGHLCVYSCHFPPCSSLYDWLCVMSS